MNMTKHEVGSLRVIASSVDDYLKNPVITKPERSDVVRVIDRILPKIMPGYHFNTTWYYSKEPFVACIRPDIEELTEKAESLVNILNDPKAGTPGYVDKWCEIKQWEISLDPRILTKDDPACVDNGDQFVAILCHEIGHVMNKDPMSFVKNYREAMLTASKMERMMMSKSAVVRKLILPMFIQTQEFKLVIQNRDQIGIELAADAYTPPEFKGALVSYIENHILTRPDTHGLVIDKAEYDGAQKTAVIYSRGTIELMKRRRNILKQHINAQYHSPNSDNYMKRLMKHLGQAVGHYDPEDGETAILSETYDVAAFERQYSDISMEATIIMESSKITDRELTILEIEAGDIKTVEDKLYIIQTIYDYMEDITKQQSARYSKLKKDQRLSEAQAKSIIDSDDRIARLNKLRTKVLSMDISNSKDHYGVFVRYPKGYEG